MSPACFISRRVLSAAICLARGRPHGLILMGCASPVLMLCSMRSVRPTSFSDKEKQSLNSSRSCSSRLCSLGVSPSQLFCQTSPSGCVAGAGCRCRPVVGRVEDGSRQRTVAPRHVCHSLSCPCCNVLSHKTAWLGRLLIHLDSVSFWKSEGPPPCTNDTVQCPKNIQPQYEIFEVCDQHWTAGKPLSHPQSH